MALVRLPFMPEWRAPVLAGTKTTTCRTRRYGVAGDEFEVEGILFRLVEVTQRPLSRARDRWWREEGFESAEAFERAWTTNHPTRGFRVDDQVWVHRFERVA